MHGSEHGGVILQCTLTIPQGSILVKVLFTFIMFYDRENSDTQDGEIRDVVMRMCSWKASMGRYFSPYHFLPDSRRRSTALRATEIAPSVSLIMPFAASTFMHLETASRDDPILDASSLWVNRSTFI